MTHLGGLLGRLPLGRHHGGALRGHHAAAHGRLHLVGPRTTAGALLPAPGRVRTWAEQ
jgi:hypothetical protein